jgi:hypothetical protein
MTFTLTTLAKPGQADLLIFPPANQAPLITLDPTGPRFNAWVKGGTQCTLELNKTQPSRSRTSRDLDQMWDDFRDSRCEYCDFYFDEDKTTDEDADGNTRTVIITSKCAAFAEGPRAQFLRHGCFMGHDPEPESDEDDEDSDERDYPTETITLPDLLYSHDHIENATSIGSIDFNWSEQHGLEATNARGMLNVGHVMQQACWGEGNEEPLFSGVISAFTNPESCFNEDLLNINEFKEVVRQLSTFMSHRPVNDIILRHPGNRIDAVLTSSDPQVRFQLLASGIDLAQLPNNILPLQRAVHAGTNGFITPPIPAIADRCWFFSPLGHLLGQIPAPAPGPNDFSVSHEEINGCPPSPALVP